MKVILTVESSFFSASQTKRWDYGVDGYVEDIEIEVPDGTPVDEMEDWDLQQLADAQLDGRSGVSPVVSLTSV